MIIREDHSELQINFLISPILIDEIPIDNISEILKISSSSISIINIVSMLPDINSQKRSIAIGQRISCV